MSLEMSYPSRCAALSSNYITVIRQEPDGMTVATDEGATEVSLNVTDGIADVVNFTNNAAEGMPYAYLITDEANVVLDVVSGSSADFEGAELGVCRVWGLAYTGTLTVEAGDNAATDTLTTDCYDLSDNFITVNRGDSFVPPILEGQVNQTNTSADKDLKSSLRLLVAPNPARSTINLAYHLQGDVAESSQVQIFNLTGQLVKRVQLPTALGENNYQMDIGELPIGTYALVFSNGKMIERQLLVKQ